MIVALGELHTPSRHHTAAASEAPDYGTRTCL